MSKCGKNQKKKKKNKKNRDDTANYHSQKDLPKFKLW